MGPAQWSLRFLLRGGLIDRKQLHQMDMTGGTGRLQGKHVLVTGGTTGIGFAIAERFLREGARVVVTGRNQELGVRAQAALAMPARAGSWPLTLAILLRWRAR